MRSPPSGASCPIRLVSSAKSWLCHPDVDRRAAIVPAGAPDEIPRLSPFDAGVHYLLHLRDAWNGALPYHQWSDQDVTVTVPASFDPAARELTAEAARTIGTEHLVLLEEPQSALYSWVNASEGHWRQQVKVGDIILVVDVGGGTTDLSVIAVTEQGEVVPVRLQAAVTEAEPWSCRRFRSTATSTGRWSSTRVATADRA